MRYQRNYGYIRNVSSPTQFPYTVGDVARQLGVSRTTVHRWITQGLVSPSATTLGGHARFSEGDLEAIKATVIEAARVAPDDAEVSS